LHCKDNKKHYIKFNINCIKYIFIKTVGELEGIDFDAFFDSDNYTHKKSIIDNYLIHRETKTSRLRDLNMNISSMSRKGKFYKKMYLKKFFT
jgi:hypothetical protein